MPESLTSS